LFFFRADGVLAGIGKGTKKRLGKEKRGAVRQEDFANHKAAQTGGLSKTWNKLLGTNPPAKSLGGGLNLSARQKPQNNLGGTSTTAGREITAGTNLVKKIRPVKK